MYLLFRHIWKPPQAIIMPSRPSQEKSLLSTVLPAGTTSMRIRQRTLGCPWIFALVSKAILIQRGRWLERETITPAAKFHCSA